MSPLPADPVGRALVQMLARDQYERWLAGEVRSLLEAGHADIVAQLTKAGNLSLGEKQRLAQMYSSINKHLGSSYGSASKFLSGEMQQFAGIEAQATRANLKVLVAKSKLADVTLQNITKDEVRAIAEFPIAGLGIGEWFQKQANDTSAALRGQIQLGLLNGLGPAEIASKIFPQRASSADPSVPDIGKRSANSARALIRTTTTTVQTQASYQTLERIDPKLIKGYRYVAVRDARTTPICRALDGKVFRFDDPNAKRPPQHVNCRSTIVAEIDYKYLGLPEPNTLKGGFTMGSYHDWLKTQSETEQNWILGKAGASLWRSGKVDLAGLIESDGRRMTGKALRALYGGSPVPAPATPPAPPAVPAPVVVPQLPPADPVPQYVRDLEDRIRANPKESGHAWDANGKLLIEKQGTKTQVVWYGPEVRKLYDAEFFTHNHPNGGSFSSADFKFMRATNIKNFRATGVEKLTGRHVDYNLERDLKGNPYSAKWWSELNKVYNRRSLENELNRRHPPWPHPYTVPESSAYKEWRAKRTHVWFEIIHERIDKFVRDNGGLKYTRTYRT